jgi:uncharacterized protein (UPF0335 family)
LFRKGFDTAKLRTHAEEHLKNRILSRDEERLKKEKQQMSRGKKEFMDELRSYYLGKVDQVKKYESQLEDDEQRFFYQWIH